MCNNNDRREDGSCITEILNIISILQKNASPDNCNDSCDRPMLGGSSGCLVCNTRPVQLYMCCGNGVPLSMPVSKDLIEVCSSPVGDNTNTSCSTVFRVEKLEGNCCTFRVLVRNPEEVTCCNCPWIATNSFFTMDINCCCCIRCLSDCCVEGL